MKGNKNVSKVRNAPRLRPQISALTRTVDVAAAEEVMEECLIPQGFVGRRSPWAPFRLPLRRSRVQGKCHAVARLTDPFWEVLCHCWGNIRGIISIAGVE